MAQVTMDIAELDKLRESIKEKDSRLLELHTTLNDVKADKRVVIKKVYASLTEYNHYFSLDVTGIVRTVSNFINGHNRGFVDSGLYNHSIEDSLKRFVKLGRSIPVDEGHSIEYTNFDDVKAELSAKLEKEYSNELGELRHIKNTLNEKIAQLIAENQDRIAALNKENDAKIASWTDAYDALTKRYQDLVEGKEELSKIETLEKTLEEANTKISKLMNRNWFQRLLNL